MTIYDDFWRGAPQPQMVFQGNWRDLPPHPVYMDFGDTESEHNLIVVLPIGPCGNGPRYNHRGRHRDYFQFTGPWS